MHFLCNSYIRSSLLTPFFYFYPLFLICLSDCFGLSVPCTHKLFFSLCLSVFILLFLWLRFLPCVVADNDPLGRLFSRFLFVFSKLLTFPQRYLFEFAKTNDVSCVLFPFFPLFLSALFFISALGKGFINTWHRYNVCFGLGVQSLSFCLCLCLYFAIVKQLWLLLFYGEFQSSLFLPIFQRDVKHFFFYRES